MRSSTYAALLISLAAFPSPQASGTTAGNQRTDSDSRPCPKNDRTPISPQGEDLRQSGGAGSSMMRKALRSPSSRSTLARSFPRFMAW